uniref:Uncharacterized protein n=2 Tax=Rhizophora mucronata TaxID=61149 RepID=A0A2P2LWJ9_RHIMU
MDVHDSSTISCDCPLKPGVVSFLSDWKVFHSLHDNLKIIRKHHQQ